MSALSANPLQRAAHVVDSRKLPSGAKSGSVTISASGVRSIRSYKNNDQYPGDPGILARSLQDEDA